VLVFIVSENSRSRNPSRIHSGRRAGAVFWYEEVLPLPMTKPPRRHACRWGGQVVDEVLNPGVVGVAVGRLAEAPPDGRFPATGLQTAAPLSPPPVYRKVYGTPESAGLQSNRIVRCLLNCLYACEKQG
jgi:hypothetical protein